MLRLPRLTIVDQTSGAVVGDQIRFANTVLARLIGPLGATTLNSGEGLLLAPSSGVHTWGMWFSIDVIAPVAAGGSPCLANTCRRGEYSDRCRQRASSWN